MHTLKDYGWTEAHQHNWSALQLNELQPARVVADFGTSLKLATPEIITAELSGKLAHYSSRDETPKVGDWVAVRLLDNSAVVESVVLRSNEIARKVTGKRILKQIFAANVDIAFVLFSLDNDFSVERLRRFLFQLSESNVKAAIILNKADKTDDVQSYISQLDAFALPIITSVATDSSNVNEILALIQPGNTAILLGSSGVGKSTLTNKILRREAQITGKVRSSDSTGRHTTVHRELFLLPNGGILIDTPGIRELQLWGSDENLEVTFADIIQLADTCRYSNCKHQKEKGCAIHKALANGTLDKKRYEDYLKLKSEIEALGTKRTERSRKDNGRGRASTKRLKYTSDEENAF